MLIKYRQAVKEDCFILAEYICDSSGGISEFLCRDLVPGKSTVELTAEFLAMEHRYDSYESNIVAVAGGKVVGTASSYPAKFHCVDKEMKEFLPADRLKHVEGFFNARIEGSYYLNSLYVHKGYRGMGIADKLINLTKEKALRQGYRELSVLVFADNSAAIKVYKRNGFRQVGHVPLEWHELIPHLGGLFLMLTSLSG